MKVVQSNMLLKAFNVFFTAARKHALKSASGNLRQREAYCPKKRLDTMLVVCYTNHALDQFLEGMLNFCPIEGQVQLVLF